MQQNCRHLIGQRKPWSEIAQGYRKLRLKTFRVQREKQGKSTLPSNPKSILGMKSRPVYHSWFRGDVMIKSRETRGLPSLTFNPGPGVKMREEQK